MERTTLEKGQSREISHITMGFVRTPPQEQAYIMTRAFRAGLQSYIKKKKKKSHASNAEIKWIKR